MKKPLLVICLLAAIVYACNQGGRTINRLLSPGNLPSQTFVIDISKDTVLTTKKGALIRIPKGALTANDNIVKLEVKEAYSMRDIVKAGLTTQSNGQPLSSGGMIYVNAVGENNARITEKIFIATPTPSLDKNMQLFKGEVQGDSTINWTDPKPLPLSPQLTALDKGKALFENNCTSCHSITKDLTGPALGGVMDRIFPAIYPETEAGVDHFYEFTRNPAQAIKHNSYFLCLKRKFGGAMMTAFPNLTDEELDNLYGYIQNETKRLNLTGVGQGLAGCKDSCEMYFEVAANWKKIKAGLEKETVDMVEEKKNPTIDTTGPSVKVSPLKHKSLYYQFTVEAFGWYNIDMLLRNNTNVKESELMVRIQGNYEERFNLYLIIPSLKVMESGGPLEDEENEYGFYTIDGKIPLPQNTTAYIIAMGERNDQIIFAKQEFITKEKQEFDLQLTTVSKEAFEQQIAALNLGDLSIKASETINVAVLKKAIKELDKAELLKPKNCDCDCFMEPLTSDNYYIGTPAK